MLHCRTSVGQASSNTHLLVSTKCFLVYPHCWLIHCELLEHRVDFNHFSFHYNFIQTDRYVRVMLFLNILKINQWPFSDFFFQYCVHKYKSLVSWGFLSFTNGNDEKAAFLNMWPSTRCHASANCHKFHNELKGPIPTRFLLVLVAVYKLTLFRHDIYNPTWVTSKRYCHRRGKISSKYPVKQSK